MKVHSSIVVKLKNDKEKIVKKFCLLLYYSTQKKKAAPYFELMYKKKKLFENFSVKIIWKIFEFSFILDQSQICISNS